MAEKSSEWPHLEFFFLPPAEMCRRGYFGPVRTLLQFPCLKWCLQPCWRQMGTAFLSQKIVFYRVVCLTVNYPRCSTPAGLTPRLCRRHSPEQSVLKSPQFACKPSWVESANLSCKFLISLPSWIHWERIWRSSVAWST